jgi:hypothetical protein
MKTSIYPAGVDRTGKRRVGLGLVGKKSGLNKKMFYIQTLKENEKAKRPDAEVQEIFDAEFPGTVSYKVSAMRSKLNGGGFGDVGFLSQSHDEPAKVKKAIATISLPDMSHEPAPAKKVRLRPGKEA